MILKTSMILYSPHLEDFQNTQNCKCSLILDLNQISATVICIRLGKMVHIEVRFQILGLSLYKDLTF